MCKLYTDVVIGHAEASFSSAARPLAALSGISICGAVMTGRQITAPPEQPVRSLLVGKRRLVAIPVTVKGSRALLKVYTDVKVEADEPKVWYNMGLEPTIALVILFFRLERYRHEACRTSRSPMSSCAQQNRHFQGFEGFT